MQPEHLELFTTFAGSEYGAKLAQETRFNLFKPDWVDTKLWGDLLGKDANNLNHMPYTYGVAEEFSVDLPTYERGVLLTTAITHDWGEAIIGDIPLPAKTAEDEDRERIAFRQIADDLLINGKALTKTVWSVLSHENERLGDMFRCVEYIGYCLTGKRAGLAATALSHDLIDGPQDRKQKAELIGGLSALNKSVEIRNYPILAGYVQKYPSARDVWRARL